MGCVCVVVVVVVCVRLLRGVVVCMFLDVLFFLR